MNDKRTKTTSAEVEKLRRMSDQEVDFIDIPATDSEFWAGADVVTPKKDRISIRLDADMLTWFRSKPRYQTLINRVLRHYYEHRQTASPLDSGPAAKPD